MSGFAPVEFIDFIVKMTHKSMAVLTLTTRVGNKGLVNFEIVGLAELTVRETPAMKAD